MTAVTLSDEPPRGADLILTGIARSGTTLACTLLNRLPGTVALLVPMSPRLLLGLPSAAAVGGAISAFLAAQRKTLLERGEAISRGRDGVIPDNPYGPSPGPGGLRRSVVTEGVVRFEKPLAADFRLVIKHPSCFTALLGGLVGRFPCFAMVRNPLAVLLSWQTTEANWNDGRQPAAEMFDDGLRRRLDAAPDRVGRQLAMLAWSFEQYARHLPAERVIRYEDLIASRGRALAGIDPEAQTLWEPLEDRNTSPLYRGCDVAGLAARLIDSDGPQWDFYSREAVALVADRLEAESGSQEMG